MDKIHAIAVLGNTINELDLSSRDLRLHGIGDGGCRELAKSLASENCHILTLNLNYNSIGIGGCRLLASVLPKSKVQYLYLENNLFGDEGCRALAKVLPQSCVHTLSLAGNNINNEGCYALAEILLNENCRIHTLDLSRNRIRVDGCRALETVLRYRNCKIGALVLMKYGITSIQDIKMINRIKDMIDTKNRNRERYGDSLRVRCWKSIGKDLNFIIPINIVKRYRDTIGFI